jgi:hypothetical protein
VITGESIHRDGVHDDARAHWHSICRDDVRVTYLYFLFVSECKGMERVLQLSCKWKKSVDFCNPIARKT